MAAFVPAVGVPVAFISCSDAVVIHCVAVVVVVKLMLHIFVTSIRYHSWQFLSAIDAEEESKGRCKWHSGIQMQMQLLLHCLVLCAPAVCCCKVLSIVARHSSLNYFMLTF